MFLGAWRGSYLCRSDQVLACVAALLHEGHAGGGKCLRALGDRVHRVVGQRGLQDTLASLLVSNVYRVDTRLQSFKQWLSSAQLA